MWITTNEPIDRILVPLNTYNLLKIENEQFYIDGETHDTVVNLLRLHMA